MCVKENKWNLLLFANVTFNVIRTNCDDCSKGQISTHLGKMVSDRNHTAKEIIKNEGVRLTSQVGSLLGDMMS